MPRAEGKRYFAGRLLALTLAVLFATQIWAFRWGVITPDTVFQWGQALTGRYDDWHPPATAWLWRQLMPLGPAAAPVLVFDCALYWLGAGAFAEALRRRGQSAAMAAVLLVAAAPIPFGQMGAILKDPLLAACCLFAAGLACIRTDLPARGRVAAGLVAALLLVFASATRINAVFATAPLFVALLPVRWSDRPWRIALALAGSAALLLLASIAIDRVALRPHRAQPIFSLVNFDLAGIVAQGGGNFYPRLDERTAARVTRICYDPRQYNPAYEPECDRVEDALFHSAAAQRLSPVGLWLHAIAAAPGAYLRHRLAHLNRNMRLSVRHVPDDAVYVMSEPNRYGLHFAETDATSLVARGAAIMARSPLGRPATWLAVALGLLAIGRRLPSRRLVLPLAGSAVAYGGGYAIVSVAPDLRYNLWTMLAAALALVVASADLARDPECRPPRATALAAALPATFVILVELAAVSGIAAAG